MINEVEIEFAPQESILGTPAVILDLDITKTTLKDLESFESTFSCPTELYGAMHGLATWFDVTFTTPKGPLVLSTSPSSQ